MNVEKRFTYEPAFVTFRSYLGAATAIARQKFVCDRKLIRAHWQATTLPESAFEEWITERLLERSPIGGSVP
jgi:hypothetical protein